MFQRSRMSPLGRLGTGTPLTLGAPWPVARLPCITTSPGRCAPLLTLSVHLHQPICVDPVARGGSGGRRITRWREAGCAHVRKQPRPLLVP